MSFNSSVFCAGAYAVTWNGSALGLFVGDTQSPAIEVVPYGAPINNTDQYGRTKLGVIGQGSDAFFAATFTEWKAAILAALMGAQPAEGRVGYVGNDYYDLAAVLVLTVQTGTLAATAGPATVTASKAIVAENNPYRIIYGPVLRETPFRMDLLPYLSSSNPVHYTKT